jgi:protease I
MSLDDTDVAIVVSNEFEDIEMEYPLLNWSARGADVTLVPYQTGNSPRPAVDGKPVTGRFGTPCPPVVINRFSVTEFDNLKLDDFDALFIPGGFSPDMLRTEDEVVEFVRDAYEANKLIAAICHGPQVLIEADIVEGKTLTCYEAVTTDLKNAGATVEDVPAVQDGNLVTGRVPDDLPEFCDAFAEALADHVQEQVA